MIRTTIALALSVLLLISLAGCGSTQSSSETPVLTNNDLDTTNNVVVGEKADESSNNSPLGDFITKIKAESIKDRLSKVTVGDYVTFGHYEQDNNLKNGSEEIEWRVIEKRSDSLLLISKYILDIQPYHASFREINWGDSSLRIWLNHDFYNAAFSEQEKTLIPSDLYILSEDLVYTYLGNETDSGYRSYTAKDVMCQLTEYAAARYIEARIKNGDTEEEAKDNCEEWVKDRDYYFWWWLSDIVPDHDPRFAAYVSGIGGIQDAFPEEVSNPLGGVRPVVRITTSVDSSLKVLGVIRDSVDGDVGELCERCGLNFEDFDDWKPGFAMSDDAIIENVEKLLNQGCSVFVIETGTFTPSMDMIRARFPNVEFVLPQK